MVTTEVTSQSWFGRIRESIKGFLFGIVLFIASFPVLFLNEGRAVKTEKSLKEGQGAVVSVPADRVDPANDKKLVHLTGQATTQEQLSDGTFGISANAIKLRRTVEMYQWEEEKKSETEKKVGGGTETKTTYSYNTKWSDGVIDSSNFKEASDHQNPGSMPYESSEQVAQNVTLGAFTLPATLVARMTDFTPVRVEEQAGTLPADLKKSLKPNDGQYYIAANPQSPQVGDVRISFSAVMPSEVSVVSKQTGNTFEPYHASAGMDIEMIRRGVHTAEAMFTMALKENTILTWILRGVGFVMMFLGLVLFFRPISVLGDVIPFIGSLLAFGTGLFALAIAAVLSLGTIGVAWVVYRPVLGIALLAVAIALLVFLAVTGKKKVSAALAARTASA